MWTLNQQNIKRSLLGSAKHYQLDSFAASAHEQTSLEGGQIIGGPAVDACDDVLNLQTCAISRTPRYDIRYDHTPFDGELETCSQGRCNCLDCDADFAA